MELRLNGKYVVGKPEPYSDRQQLGLRFLHIS